jgi:hypothetical protein
LAALDYYGFSVSAAGAAMIVSSEYEDLNEAQRLDALNRIVAEWREPGLVRVLPARVIPDTTNRDGTGLSLMHLHNIASSMVLDGFTPRNHATGLGHDLPLVVRERTGTASTLGDSSLEKWSRAQAAHTDYPQTQPWASAAGEEFFCSLGNGHFFQALNLVGTGARCKFFSEPPVAGDPRQWPEAYSATANAPLHMAVTEGVEAVVLKPDMPKAARKFVSQMLNAAFEYVWLVDADGSVRVDHQQQFRSFTSYDGMVKHADAWQLDEIVELHMRREAKERQQQAVQ